MNAYEIGDVVECAFAPLYWDEWDNSDNPDDYDVDDLVPEGEHPGFTEGMSRMLNGTYEVVEVHRVLPWVMLTSNSGDDFWWHVDWIYPKQQSRFSLSEHDKSSKYLSVINKIKKMQQRRSKNGYAF